MSEDMVIGLDDIMEHAAEAEIFLKQFANKTRLMVLCSLLKEEKSVTELLEVVSVSQPVISQHLALLRESAEVANQPVPSALHIPRGVLEMKALEQFKDASAPLYIHCASGVRAKLAAEQLIKMGYENVSVVTCPVPTINQAN